MKRGPASAGLFVYMCKHVCVSVCVCIYLSIPVSVHLFQIVWRKVWQLVYMCINECDGKCDSYCICVFWSLWDRVWQLLCACLFQLLCVSFSCCVCICFSWHVHYQTKSWCPRLLPLCWSTSVTPATPMHHCCHVSARWSCWRSMTTAFTIWKCECLWCFHVECCQTCCWHHSSR